MRHFLKGLGALVAVGIVVAGGYALLVAAVAVLPFVVLFLGNLLLTLLALAAIIGIAAVALYIPYAIGKALSGKPNRKDNN